MYLNTSRLLGNFYQTSTCTLLLLTSELQVVCYILIHPDLKYFDWEADKLKVGKHIRDKFALDSVIQETKSHRMLVWNWSNSWHDDNYMMYNTKGENIEVQNIIKQGSKFTISPEFHPPNKRFLIPFLPLSRFFNNLYTWNYQIAASIPPMLGFIKLQLTNPFQSRPHLLKPCALSSYLAPSNYRD